MERKLNWDIRYLGNLHELNSIESRYGSAGDDTLQQRICHPENCTVTNRRSTALFVGLHNLEASIIRIDVWAVLWIDVSRWRTEDCKGSPLLFVMTPWIFTYLTSWIQALADNESLMHSIWCIAVEVFAIITVASFLEAAELGIERHETNDSGLSTLRDGGSGVLLPIPDHIKCFFSPR